MPNYRQKNKNKRNKNRNKNNNQTKTNEQPQQQQKLQQNDPKVNNEQLLQQQHPHQQQRQQQDEQQQVGTAPIMPATQSSNDDDLITARIAPPTVGIETDNNCNENSPSAKSGTLVAASETAKNAVPIDNVDTVSRDTATEAQRFSTSGLATAATSIGKNCHTLATEMGAAISKEQPQDTAVCSTSGKSMAQAKESAEMRTISITRQQGKVIVHRVIQEGTASSSEEEVSSINSQVDDTDPKVIVHAADQQPDETNTIDSCNSQAKVIIHRIVREEEEAKDATEAIVSTQSEPKDEQKQKVVVHRVLQEAYRVESPQPMLQQRSSNTIGKMKKSHSLDDDEEDSSCLQIQEISDNSSGGETDNPPLISEAESESELLSPTSADEEQHNSAKIISIQTLPMDEDDDEEFSKLSPLGQENYKQRRAQKRAAIETHFLPQYLSPRYLDSIKEENSDMSDARSENSDLALSRSASANFDDELDDAHDLKTKKANAIFPRSNLDFSKKHKHGSLPKAPTLPSAIREETAPMMVEAKIIEQATITERCSSWSSGLTPESEAAEVVYINSASSSLSDLMELDFEETAADNSCSSVDLDTDVRVIIAKPAETAIATSDTQVARETKHSEKYEDNQRESTPVNQPSVLVEDDAKQTNIRMISTTEISNEHNNSQQLLAASKNDFSAYAALEADDSISSNNKNDRDLESCEISQSYSRTIDGGTLPASCVSIANRDIQSSEWLSNSQMNDIREILNDAANKTNFTESVSSSRASHIAPHRVAPPPPVKGVYNLHEHPPPIPPPPQTYNTNHSASENIAPPVFRTGEAISAHNFQTLADASHTTLQEITSPTSPKPNILSSLIRQESADSHCSDSTTHSQCTAINMDSLPHSDWGDFDAESSVSGEKSAPTTDGDQSISCDSFDAASTICSNEEEDNSDTAIKKLRLLCTETLASMPYGEDILEELASVAENIGEVRATNSAQKSSEMPYPLPDLPHITDIQVSVNSGYRNHPTNVALTQTPPHSASSKLSSPPPPPVPAPPTKYDSWLGLPTESDPKLLVCLSPSQRSFMAEDKTSIANKPDHLLDAHKKFIERRGYHEYTTEQVNAMNSEKAAEYKIIQTAAMMKKLRKSLTPPPPPIPPPPVPAKSSSTDAKAHPTIRSNGASFGNTNDQRSLFADEEENKHRLLAIIHDSNEAKPNQNQSSTSSSHENNSRQTSKKPADPLEPKPTQKQTQATAATTPFNQKTEQNLTNVKKTEHLANSDISSKHSEHLVASSSTSTSSSSRVQQSVAPSPQSEANKMQGIDSEFEKLFPSMGQSDIFDSKQKRFSNIETSTRSPFCAQILNTQPKRYSNIETSSYESKKRIENGQVVYDISDTKRESFVDGNKVDSSIVHFPVAEASPKGSQWPHSQGNEQSVFADQTSFEQLNKSTANPRPASSNVEEIMSALKLNSSAAPLTTFAVEQQEAPSLHVDTTSTHSTTQTQSHEKSEKSINSQHRENSILNKNISSTYEEFRQRAKEAAEKATAPFTAPAASNRDHPHKSAFHFDHEKLFSDFDELSKQLNMELESGKAKKEQREKSASLYDLSRMQSESKTRFEELKEQRHEHMQELEREIERSRRARQLKIPVQLENGNRYTQVQADPYRRQSMPRTFEVPIQIERDNGFNQAPASAPVINAPRTYEIPVHVDPDYTVTSKVPPENQVRDDYTRFRRAESMFNLSDSQQHRQRTSSTTHDANSNADDWTRYASDLGSSENITRPFAREVEICYQRCRPNVIRAPRMAVSTNDLTSNINSFDNYNAYNTRRTHAPMLNQAPQRNKPQYLSCHSMIERDPNPTYISTTSRRGVSPAPPTSAGNLPIATAPTSCSMQSDTARQRRASLPREIHEQQLKYIQSKEEELKTEFDRLENERRRLVEEMQRAPTMPVHVPRTIRDTYRPMIKLPTLSEDEVFRQQMAEEWLNKVAEREERRLQKIIKISKINEETLGIVPTQVPCPKTDIGDEFLKRVKERRSKLAMPSDSDWESGAESQPLAQGHASENEEVPPVKIIEGKAVTDLRQLPKHMREFAKFSNHERQELDGGHREVHQEEEKRQEANENSVSSATKKSSIIKTYKVSKFPGASTLESSRADTASKPSRPEAASKEEALRLKRQTTKTALRIQQQSQQELQQHHHHHHHHHHKHQLPPIAVNADQRQRKPAEAQSSDIGSPTQPYLTASNANYSNAAVKRRKQTRFLLTPNRRSWSESDLLREIDNELQLAKGFLYADVYNIKHEYMSEPETDHDHPRKMAQLARRQYDGIGPVTNDGMPIILRSEVKEPHQHEWYKRLYQTIHKQKNGGRYQYKANGYVSEPEPNYDDSDYSTVKYRTLDRRRLQSTSASTTNVRSAGNYCQDEAIYGTMPNPIKSGQSSYKNQPGRIEDYITGHSSVSEKEKKEHLNQTKLSPLYTEGNLSRALAKESGYASDSNLVFRKKEVPLRNPLSPVEQKEAYKSVQAGGEPPLFGFRKPAPEKPKESPNRYLESDVNIHYKTPIRYEYKDPIPEEELAIRQAEQMQKLYHEERRRKYLQELQDMNSRRHTDNFTPTQKSPISLNRYDDFQSDLAPKSPNTALFPKTVARALYNFQGQTARELSFKKGDVIYIRRQIDKNWYEGEHNAMIGLLPANYVELLSKDGVRQPPRKPSEGHARAKYNFQAQSGIELSLNKGELVTLTRRVDDNWFEGKIANRKGIFPVSYVEILSNIGSEDLNAPRTIITSNSITNMRPSLESMRTNINNEFNTITQNGHQPPNGILRETRNIHKTDVLHVDTSTDPIAYRALYKYRPQNSDELELLEGDIVLVLEKCDDGWFVGTSQRTGCFGTFPGNYVERA